MNFSSWGVTAAAFRAASSSASEFPTSLFESAPSPDQDKATK